MRIKIHFFILTTGFLIFGAVNPSIAQSGIRAFGIQFKPIFPLGLVNTDGQTIIDETNNTRLEISEKGGYSLGAVIRIGFSKRFSLETGISFIRRNYGFKLNSSDFTESQASLRFTGYEIPAIGMIFVKLGQQTYMNASAGVVVDLFPTGGVVAIDRDTIEYGILETNWRTVN